MDEVGYQRDTQVGREVRRTRSKVEVPLFVIFEGKRPSLELLASEALYNVRHPHESDTLRSRVVTLGLWWRLSRAARWQDPSYSGKLRFLWTQGVRRNGFRLYAFVLALLALQAIRNPTLAPATWLHSMVYVGFGCLLAAVLWANFMWTDHRTELEWANAYQDSRMEIERHLLSPAGYDGVRLEKNAAGGWELHDVPRE